MGKIRVHELSKKYKKDNKEFLEIIKTKLKIEAKSHLSGLDEKDVKTIENYFSESVKKTPEKKVIAKKEPIKLTKVVEQKDDKKPSENPKPKKTLSTPKKPVPNSKKRNFRDGMTFNKKKSAEIAKPDKKKIQKKREKELEKATKDDVKIITFESKQILLKNLARKLKINSAELVRDLFLKGHLYTMNSVVDFALAEEIANNNNTIIEIEHNEFETLSFGEKFKLEIEDKEENLHSRAPIVTIMGHVDHGKTSLLDALRETTVADGEAGGITQKIGAYQVEHNDEKITFIDTPGHEAFTEMRARGSKATDVAILVVAADDGVMPQTIEAISHAKEADVPVIVAINKIDRPESNPMKVKQQLSEHELVSVEWGGNTEFVEISAKNKTNLEALLETVALTSEILELKANPNKRAKGIVLESRLNNQKGAVVDLIILEGSLNIGDIVVSKSSFGKLKAMINENNQRIKTAFPSQPVEVIGFNKIPEAGDIFYVVKHEKDAKKIIAEIEREEKIEKQNIKNIMSLDNIYNKLEDSDFKEIKLILKVDSKGSLEALKKVIGKIKNEEVSVKIIHSSSGEVTEGDVKLAEASNAIIIGFHVRPSLKAKILAESKNVEIRTYDVIYHITEELEKSLKGMLSPKFKEEYLGRTQVREIFKISKVGNIAGCLTIDGKIKKDAKVRVVREGVIIYTGDIANLKRYKSEVDEVVTGQECGLAIVNYNDIKSDDIIEAFREIEVKQ